MRTAILLALAGCWTGSTRPSAPMTDDTKRPPAAAPILEHRATLRIDAQPGGKRFQGVWLELGDGRTWVIDYRPRLPWRGFDGHAVLVTGGCYEPYGQAILATHFRVERLRLADPARGQQPYLEVGPERLVRGELVLASAPAGSKPAGSSALMFRADDGVMWETRSDKQLSPGPALVRARVLVADLAYAARSGEADLWIADTHELDYVEEPSMDRPIDCATAPLRR